jgi:hypothetical protein
MDLLFQRRHFPKLNGVRSVSERALESPGEPWRALPVPNSLASFGGRFGEKISGTLTPTAQITSNQRSHREIFGNLLNISPLVFPGDHVQKTYNAYPSRIATAE